MEAFPPFLTIISKNGPYEAREGTKLEQGNDLFFLKIVLEYSNTIG